MEVFGKNLRRIRKEKNLSMDALAELAGTSKQVLSRYENGERVPKISMVKKLADAMNVSLAELSGDIELGETKKKLHDIGQQLTPLSRSNAPPGLTSTDYALHDVMLSLSEGARQDVLEFALFRQAQEKKEKARHDD